jgi:hypothetical protein
LLSELLHDPFDQAVDYPMCHTFFGGARKPHLFIGIERQKASRQANLQTMHSMCTPFVPEWKETAANKVSISVQGDCWWDQMKGG